MSSEDGCPLCGKPVLGRTALLGHLEFAHEVDDPGSFLEELLRPDAPARRRLPVGAAARRAGPVLAVAALVGASFVGYRQLVVESSADTAAAQAADAEATTTTTAVPAAAPTTVAPSTSTTAAPTTTTTTTTTAPPPTTTTTTSTPAAPRSDLEFRKPFLVDAGHDGCRVVDGQAVHTISFTFSGSRNITFDGVFHPDRTGDGRQTTTHAVPAGTRGYLDHVVVLDPAGDAHDVGISPPIYLAAC
ncbi:MAG TPA: hypothetical protein VFU14_01050 [Acidimicrobiales bacterium]|nr:hypothetical protein [Acidimicrobiales bacterium]